MAEKMGPQAAQWDETLMVMGEWFMGFPIQRESDNNALQRGNSRSHPQEIYSWVVELTGL